MTIQTISHSFTPSEVFAINSDLWCSEVLLRMISGATDCSDVRMEYVTLLRSPAMSPDCEFRRSTSICFTVHANSRIHQTGRQQAHRTQSSLHCRASLWDIYAVHASSRKHQTGKTRRYTGLNLVCIVDLVCKTYTRSMTIQTISYSFTPLEVLAINSDLWCSEVLLTMISGATDCWCSHGVCHATSLSRKVSRF